MMFTLPNFAFFAMALVLPCLSALKMEEVSISGGKEFLRLQEVDNPVLECKYVLDEGETVKAVTWYHDNFKALMWGPPEPTNTGEGLEEGDAILTREDGNLEFAILKDSLAGIYRCEVMTSSGETSKSPDYQLLVVDMPVIPDMGESSIENCVIKFSWSAPAVKPKPEPICGVWSEAHGYILSATSWMATPYNNGSIAYRLEEEKFEIFHVPLDALIRCEIKITKVNDHKIQLLENSYNFTEVWERGCPPLEVGDGIDLEYDNERITCHAEVRPKDESAAVIARVKCKDGFIPKYEDFVSSVELICQDTKWNIGGDKTWNHFDNLLCTEKPKLPQRPPTSKTSSMENLEDSSSGVNRLFSPWVLLFLLAATVTSGLIWGLRSHPRKKDPRFMA